MYIRSIPPSGLSLEGLVEWLRLEFQSLESALAEQDEELRKVKERQDAL